MTIYESDVPVFMMACAEEDGTNEISVVALYGDMLQ